MGKRRHVSRAIAHLQVCGSRPKPPRQIFVGAVGISGERRNLVEYPATFREMRCGTAVTDSGGVLPHQSAVQRLAVATTPSNVSRLGQ